MSASLYVIRNQVRHVLDDEDAALRAMKELPDDQYVSAICSRRAKLHNALRVIADMIDGVVREDANESAR